MTLLTPQDQASRDKMHPVELAVREKYDELAEAMALVRAYWLSAREPLVPASWHGALLDLRERLDAADPLIAESAQFRDEIRERARDLRAAATEAFDARMADLAGTAHRRREFEGVKDRESQARLAVVDTEREARSVERAANIAAGAHERLREAWWGLRALREEVLATLDYLPWERSMER